MKNGIKNFHKEHHGSIIILKMVNDPLRVWKENHGITMFRCYFCINKGQDHILLVDDKKSYRDHMKRYSMLSSKGGIMCPTFRIISKHFSFCKIPWFFRNFYTGCTRRKNLMLEPMGCPLSRSRYLHNVILQVGS